MPQHSDLPGVSQPLPLSKADANHDAANVIPIIREVQRAGAKTLRAIADALNARGISTPRGGLWHATSVKNALARA
jgi:Recombinase